MDVLAFEEMLTMNGIYKAKEASLQRLRDIYYDSNLYIWRKAYLATKNGTEKEIIPSFVTSLYVLSKLTFLMIGVAITTVLHRCCGTSAFQAILTCWLNTNFGVCSESLPVHPFSYAIYAPKHT